MCQDKKMYKQRTLLILVTVLSSVLQAQGVDKYTDENRPYEFGFNIEGEQHRHEKKDERGIIMGEFGFITADGVYHVTVYATDENGNFKILSMKNIRVKPYPTGPERQGHALTLPSTPSQKQPGQKPPQQGGPVPQQTAGPVAPAPAKSCSHCSIPTTTTIKPLPPKTPEGISNSQSSPGTSNANYPNMNGLTNVAQNAGYPISNGQNNFNNNPQGINQPTPGVVGLTPQSQNDRNKYPQGSNRPIASSQNVFINNPQGESNLIPGQNTFNTRPQITSNPNALGQNVYNKNTQGTSSPNFPTQNINSPNYPKQGFGGLQLNPQQGEQSPDLQPQIPISGERNPKQYDDYPKQSSNPEKPTLTYAQMQIVDKDTDIYKLSHGEKEGLPNGLTKNDMMTLLYTFNYTVGFHGHFEEGYTNGAKQGYYFVTGRNGVRTRIDYVADEKGFRPKITQEVLDLLSEEVPKPETEKDEKYGLKGYEFKWLYYPVEKKTR